MFYGITFPSVSHAFLAAQAPITDTRIAISKAPLASLPRIAAGLGTPSESFSIADTMRRLLEYKFGSSTFTANDEQIKLAIQLIRTGKRPLIFGNNTCSQFLGDCQCSLHTNERGKNVLGGLLMGIRDKVIEKAVNGTDLDETCGCENKSEAFFLYSHTGKLWLRPFCKECQTKTGVHIAKIVADGIGTIIRFEREWAKKKERVVNKIIVPPRSASSGYTRSEDWRNNMMGPWMGKLAQEEDDEPVGTPLPQNITFYLSGRISDD